MAKYPFSPHLLIEPDGFGFYPSCYCGCNGIGNTGPHELNTRIRNRSLEYVYILAVFLHNRPHTFYPIFACLGNTMRQI